MTSYINENIITYGKLSEFIKYSSNAIFRSNTFINPYAGTELEDNFSLLHRHMQLAMECEGTFMMVALQTTLIESGGLVDVEQFIAFLDDSIRVVYPDYSPSFKCLHMEKEKYEKTTETINYANDIGDQRPAAQSAGYNKPLLMIIGIIITGWVIMK